MRKFFGLMKNEWKKMLRRKSLWVMAVILAVLAVGMILLQDVSSSYYDDYFFYTEENWDPQSEIDFYKQFLNETDAEGNPTYEAQKAVEIITRNQKIIDCGLSMSDWRVTCGVLDTWSSAKANREIYSYYSDEDIAELERIIDEGDKNAYFDWQYLTQASQNYPEYKAHYEWMAQYCKDHALTPGDQTDRYYSLALDTLQARIALQDYNEKIAAGESVNEDDYAELSNATAILNYQVEHDIPINPLDSFGSEAGGIIGIIGGGFTRGCSDFWNAMSFSAQLVTVIGLFLIILAGGVVSSEFSQGTIKFLLINPVKRWKILASKYATVLIFGVILMVELFLATFVPALIISGISGTASEAFQPGVSASNGVAYTVSPYLKLIVSYLLSGVEVLLMATLAFALSSLTRSTALAVGTSLFVYLSGSILVVILQGFGFDWARYLVFANTNFLSIVNGTTGFPHQSLFTAILIDVLHMIVFLWTALDGFVRREV